MFFFILAFSVIPLGILQAREWVKVYSVKSAPTRFDFYADNDGFCPFQIEVTALTSWGMTATHAFPYYTVVGSLEKKRYLFSVHTSRTNIDRISHYSQSSIGDPSEVAVNPSYPYIFPYMQGESTILFQGYEGGFSHKGWLRYSLDFGMVIGTPVCAARSGIVVDYKDDSSLGGNTPYYRPFANYITVYHTDGTFGQYVHLNKDGSLVRPGDTVRAGQVIGYSGNTGWTKGPHLHFMVYKPVYMAKDTLPVAFLMTNGVSARLVSKQTYTSWHPVPDALESIILSSRRSGPMVIFRDTNIPSGTSLGGY